MNILCTICVRGGSKGIKNKNIKKIKNEPLVCHSVNQAIKSKLFDEIVVSSDSKKILDIVKKSGVKNLIKRPKKLANDSSPKIPVIRHSLMEMEKKHNKTFDIIIDLDATSPLREILDIKKALKKMISSKSNNLITACLSRRNPYFNAIEFKKNKIQPVKILKKQFTSRQEAPVVYDMNASIYIWKRNLLLKSNTVFNKKTSVYIMPEERSFDIDSEFDFKIVSTLLN
jgi:CMP-N-acetylneuraminic acid synthetase